MKKFGPVSMDRPTVSAWLVEESRPRKIYRPWASKHAELMYEWAAMRAGELDPAQREDQLKAAHLYVETLVTADETGTLRPKGILGPIFIEFVLPFLIKALAEVLFDWLFGHQQDPKAVGALPEWQRYTSSGGRDVGSSDPR